MKYYILSILIITFTGCSTKKDDVLFNQTKKTEHREVLQSSTIQFEYKIVPNDRISVLVYKHPELSTTTNISNIQEKGLLVNSKGYIRLPLVKKVKIIGLSQTQAEEKISNAFSTYLKHPDVQIEVLNKKAYIIGEVNRPGEIKLDNERLTLLQVIAIAGDLTTGADRQSILVFKAGDASNVRTKLINLTDKNSLLTANLMVEPNDIVYVMPNNIKIFNNGIAEVRPIFNLIGTVLNPFMTVKVLSNQ